MRSLLFLALLLPLVGCAKKTAKNTGRADDTAPPPADKPQAGTPDKGKKDEKPTWLMTKPKDGELPADAPGTGKPPWVANPPPTGVTGQNPTPVQPSNPVGQPVPAVTPAVGPPPTGAITPTTPATPTGPAGVVVTKADMNEVWIFIENFSQANEGKMPTTELVIAALAAAKSPAADLVKSGYIRLRATTARESVWAFERNAPDKGGWIASQNGPEQVTAAEFARRIRE
jgi:hypothetical protein